jgi:hypothetical protein
MDSFCKFTKIIYFPITFGQKHKRFYGNLAFERRSAKKTATAAAGWWF